MIVPDLEMPEYYLKPFHAYKEGNMCWESAMEVRREGGEEEGGSLH